MQNRIERQKERQKINSTKSNFQPRNLTNQKDQAATLRGVLQEQGGGSLECSTGHVESVGETNKLMVSHSQSNKASGESPWGSPWGKEEERVRKNN